jgi:hypothetical protein
MIRYLDFAVTRPQQVLPGIGMWIVWSPGRSVGGVVAQPKLLYRGMIYNPARLMR